MFTRSFPKATTWLCAQRDERCTGPAGTSSASPVLVSAPISPSSGGSASRAGRSLRDCGWEGMPLFLTAPLRPLHGPSRSYRSCEARRGDLREDRERQDRARDHERRAREHRAHRSVDARGRARGELARGHRAHDRSRYGRPLRDLREEALDAVLRGAREPRRHALRAVRPSPPGLRKAVDREEGAKRCPGLPPLVRGAAVPRARARRAEAAVEGARDAVQGSAPRSGHRARRGHSSRRSQSTRRARRRSRSPSGRASS